MGETNQLKHNKQNNRNIDIIIIKIIMVQHNIISSRSVLFKLILIILILFVFMNIILVDKNFMLQYYYLNHPNDNNSNKDDNNKVEQKQQHKSQNDAAAICSVDDGSSFRITISSTNENYNEDNRDVINHATTFDHMMLSKTMSSLEATTTIPEPNKNTKWSNVQYGRFERKKKNSFFSLSPFFLVTFFGITQYI